jgi:hypothetical protein
MIFGYFRELIYYMVYSISANIEHLHATDKGKAIFVTGHEGLWDCETSRLPHFLDSRLTDAGEVLSLMLQPFTPRKIPGTYFC